MDPQFIATAIWVKGQFLDLEVLEDVGTQDRDDIVEIAQASNPNLPINSCLAVFWLAV